MLNFNIVNYLLNPNSLLNNDYLANSGTTNDNSIFSSLLSGSLNDNSLLNNSSTDSTGQAGNDSLLGSLVQIISMLVNLISNDQNGTNTYDNSGNTLAMSNDPQTNIDNILGMVNTPDLSGLISDIENNPDSGQDTQSQVESYLLDNYGGNIDQVIENLTGLQSLPIQIQAIDNYIFDQIVQNMSNQVDSAVQSNSDSSSSDSSSDDSNADYLSGFDD